MIKREDERPVPGHVNKASRYRGIDVRLIDVKNKPIADDHVYYKIPN